MAAYMSVARYLNTFCDDDTLTQFIKPNSTQTTENDEVCETCKIPSTNGSMITDIKSVSEFKKDMDKDIIDPYWTIDKLYPRMGAFPYIEVKLK